MKFIVATVATSLATLFIAACGGGASEPTGGHETYSEGTVRLAVEMLDTGLLKGNAFADASDGWTIFAIRVEAVDHREASWPVIEFPQGQGSAHGQEFFEVTIQELPRGEKVAVTVVVTFENADGDRIERTATDLWPP
jgi:hypothetical protein